MMENKRNIDVGDFFDGGTLDWGWYIQGYMRMIVALASFLEGERVWGALETRSNLRMW